METPKTLEIHDFMKLKNCGYHQVRSAIDKKILVKKVIQLTGIVGGNRRIHIVMNEAAEKWQAPTRKERSGLIKIKKGDCWTYRNDVMGIFCQHSINTEVYQ